jgi:hypothetical protein
MDSVRYLSPGASHALPSLLPTIHTNEPPHGDRLALRMIIGDGNDLELQFQHKLQRPRTANLVERVQAAKGII